MLREGSPFVSSFPIKLERDPVDEDSGSVAADPYADEIPTFGNVSMESIINQIIAAQATHARPLSVKEYDDWIQAISTGGEADGERIYLDEQVVMAHILKKNYDLFYPDVEYDPIVDKRIEEGKGLSIDYKEYIMRHALKWNSVLMFPPGKDDGYTEDDLAPELPPISVAKKVYSHPILKYLK